MRLIEIKDITWSNKTMPAYPEGMPLWARVLCLLGYHKREERAAGPKHKFPGMKLRDQCGRCSTLLGEKKR